MLPASDLFYRECFGKLCKTGSSTKARKIRQTKTFRQMIERGFLPFGVVLGQIDKKLCKKRLHVRRKPSEKDIKRVNNKE